MIYGITLILLGILAAPSLILSKRPDAQEILDKITPYQGWIGLVFFFWGVWGIISAVLNLGMLSHSPVWWITWLATSSIEAILGFILGYGMINKLILSNSVEAKQKGQALLSKLAPIQGKLGLIGILVGFWAIIATFI